MEVAQRWMVAMYLGGGGRGRGGGGEYHADGDRGGGEKSDRNKGRMTGGNGREGSDGFAGICIYIYIYIHKYKIRQSGDKIRLRSGGKMYEEEGA